jgi:DNA-binding MarR family transcriptional regulator
MMDEPSRAAIDRAAEALIASVRPADADLASARAVREGVIRLARRLQAQRHHELGPTAMSVLSRLYRGGPTTAKALADAEGTQPQSLTRTLATLEDNGYVERRDHPTDGRQVLLSITAGGLELLRKHGADQVVWLHQAMTAELTLAEREIIAVAARLLDQIADHRP